MRILEDGRVEIRNKNTGEVRVVTSDQLPNYGISYSKYATELEAYKKVGGQTTAQITPELSETEKKRLQGKTDADRVISQLESQYFGAPGEAEDLAKGRLGGLLSMGKAAVGMQSQLKTYKNTLQALRPTLARAAGDVGNLSLPEQKAAIKQLPTEFSTPEEAIKGFQAIRQRFGLPEKDVSEISGPAKNQAQVTFPGITNLLTKAIPEYYKSYENGIPPYNEQITAQKKLVKEAIPAGVEAVSTIGIFSLLKNVPKAVISPMKLLGAKRAEVATKAALKGVRIEGEGIAKAVMKAADEAPVTARSSARKFALEAIDKYAGKQFTPQQALADKVASWRAGYTASGPSKTAAAWIERAVGGEIKNQIATKAPEVAASDKLFSLLYKGTDVAKKGITQSLKLSALGRLLGLGGGGF